MTRAIVAVEMLSLNYNGIMELKEIPTYQNVRLFSENIFFMTTCNFFVPVEYKIEISMSHTDHNTLLERTRILLI